MTGLGTGGGYEAAAQLNVLEYLRPDARFPQNVFAGSWASHRFMVSDRMFAEDFVVAIKELLVLEGAQIASLVNLDRPNADGPAAAFFLSSASDPVAYNTLMGDVANGYVSRERFGCSSDIGDWCFYCENTADIAVVAIRRSSDIERFGAPLKRLRAKPLLQLAEKGGKDAEFGPRFSRI